MAKHRMARTMARLSQALTDAASVSPDGAAFDISWYEASGDEADGLEAASPRYCITIAPRPIEKIGGAQDGDRRTPSYHLRLMTVMALFSRIDETILCFWRPDDTPEDQPTCAGPHFSILGRLRGVQVLLNFLICSPAGATPCLLEDVHGQFHSAREDA